MITQAKLAKDMAANSVVAEQEGMNSVLSEYLNIMTEDSEITPPEPAGIPETTSYVGYYADVNGDGSVDGIIYADLAFTKSGTWNPIGESIYDSYGTYSYTKQSNLKKYKVEGTASQDGFGSKGIVKPNGGSGNERFYVMALDDVDSSYHCWWDDAYGTMTDYSSTTSVDFGKGEQNTTNMREKWNTKPYGAKNDGSYTDMWGLSAVLNGTWNESSGWYVPSRGEWAAFGDNLEITQSNYSNRGLSDHYWSSSQRSTTSAWNAFHR